MDNEKDCIIKSTSSSLKEKKEISVSVSEDVAEHVDNNTEDNISSDVVKPPVCETSKD